MSHRFPNIRLRSFAGAAAVMAGLIGPAFASTPAYEDVHNFHSLTRDGNTAQGGLIADAAGNFYGTTYYGGLKGNSGGGTVYELTPTGKPNEWAETILYSFTGGADGANPRGGLAMDANGVLYGTTQTAGAGSNDAGTVFSLTPPKTAGAKWKETTLWSFCSRPGCLDGLNPYAGVTIGNGGVLFGTTYGGGSGVYQGGGAGVVYRLTPPKAGATKWTEKVLYNFCQTQPNCDDGGLPYTGRLVLSSSGALYGTASRGNLDGTLYGLTPQANGNYMFSVLHTFGGNGQLPLAGLVADNTGMLYGTTKFDVSNSCGTVYEIQPTMGPGTYHVLYTFCSKPNNTDGAYPTAALTIENNPDGSLAALYGTGSSGGSGDGGVVFRLLPSTTTPWRENVLYNFCTQSNCSDGSTPSFGPLLLFGKSLFGTTVSGGLAGEGVVYGVKK